MSDTSKFPFDSIPLDGGTAVADAPRPSFSRSVPDVSTAGLLPPTRKPVAVVVPELPPAATPPVEQSTPNPMASTPPPKAGSFRSFLWDLVRPTRTKWAILAGGVSLVAGAYGLNLVAPSPPSTPKKKELPEAVVLLGASPQIHDERQRPPSVGEERIAAVPPVKETNPTPLAPLPSSTPSVPLPLPDLSKPIVPVKAEEPAALPVNPLKPELPATGTPLPVPVTLDKSVAPTPLPVPVVPPTDSAPILVPKSDDRVVTPIKPVEPLPLPGLGAQPEKKSEEIQLPKPVAFTEEPDPTRLPAESTPVPLPAPTPIKADPIPSPVPAPEMKFTPVNDSKLLPALPPVGGTVSEPKADKPLEVVPLPVKPLSVEPKQLEPVPAPPVVPVAEKKPDPISIPFKETPSPAITPAVEVKGAATAPLSSPPPKKGFEVDVVKVRATDTYTSISEAYYQSRKYATVLRAFNGDVDISRLQEVEVPPLFELQKLAGYTRDAEPNGRTAVPLRGSSPSEPPVRGPVIEPTGDAGESADWGPAGKRRPVTKYEKYTTPKEGMTVRDVARAVYADENEWPRLIAPRGARLRADDRLPRGTELTVPREELMWK